MASRIMTACALLLAVPTLWASPASNEQRESVTFAPTRAVMTLILGSEAAQSLGAHRPGTLDPNSAPEVALMRECANGQGQHSQTERGFLFDIVQRSWRVLLQPIAISVHEELQKYTQISGATAGGEYYAGGDATAGAPLTSRISCLRFTRFVGNESDEVALDFVTGVRLDRGRDAIRLRPLRLFISRGAAKSANGQYSVAVAVRADAVWRDEYSGHQGIVFEHTVATERVDLSKGSYLKYYALDADSGTRVPIVPVSFGADRTHDFGDAEFTVSVVELGTPPATLTLLANMLPGPDEKLTNLLIAAATAGSGPQ